MSAAERRAAISDQIAQYQHHQQQFLQEIQATLHNATQVLYTGAGMARTKQLQLLSHDAWWPAGRLPSSP
jgi:hypothetical protein